eukprot:COSAG04_NODE_21790_length_367_cov_0.955224_1_plen_47_part_10
MVPWRQLQQHQQRQQQPLRVIVTPLATGSDLDSFQPSGRSSTCQASA